MEPCPAAFVELAHALADVARPIVMGHFRTRMTVDAKDDRSPVTEADRAAEAAMRVLIREAFPEHGIMGEEHGLEPGDGEYVWVLDPIDGTQSFVTGKPLFGTLIALNRNGAPILGLMDMPALDERWQGARGHPSTFNGAAVGTRPCAGLGDAWLYATSPHMFPGADFHAFEGLRKKTRRCVYGAECYAYALLAAGHVDLVVESTMQPYDYCALVPIVEGAGGIITDWQGAPLTDGSDGRILAAGDGRMHQAAAVVLNGATG